METWFEKNETKIEGNEEEEALKGPWLQKKPGSRSLWPSKEKRWRPRRRRRRRRRRSGKRASTKSLSDTIAPADRRPRRRTLIRLRSAGRWDADRNATGGAAEITRCQR